MPRWQTQAPQNPARFPAANRRPFFSSFGAVIRSAVNRRRGSPAPEASAEALPAAVLSGSANALVRFSSAGRRIRLQHSRFTHRMTLSPINHQLRKASSSLSAMIRPAVLSPYCAAYCSYVSPCETVEHSAHAAASSTRRMMAKGMEERNFPTFFIVCSPVYKGDRGYIPSAVPVMFFPFRDIISRSFCQGFPSWLP